MLTVCVWLTTEKASESWMRRGRSAARVTSMGATLKRKRRLLCAEETVVMRSRRLAPPSLHVTSVLPVSAASCTPGAISERSSYTSTTCRTMSRGGDEGRAPGGDDPGGAGPSRQGGVRRVGVGECGGRTGVRLG